MNNFWDQVAHLPGHSAVVDYQPAETHWARYLTILHRLALKQAIGNCHELTVVDFGCGVGRISSWLAEEAKLVIGVDASTAMIAEALQRNQQSNIEYRHWDPENHQYDQQADLITSIWVLQHVIADQEMQKILDYFSRTLRPGGLLFTIDRLSRESVDHGESEYLRLRTLVDYTSLMQKANCELVDAYPIMIDEQVLGSFFCSSIIKHFGWGKSFFARRELAVAHKTQRPLLADYICVFKRKIEKK